MAQLLAPECAEFPWETCVQAVSAMLPSWSLYLPLAQSVQEAGDSAYVPAGHASAVYTQLVEPTGEYFPAEQSVQTKSDGAA